MLLSGVVRRVKGERMAEALVCPACGRRQPGGAFDNESMSAICPGCGVRVRPPVGRWRVLLTVAATAAVMAGGLVAQARLDWNLRDRVGLAVFTLLLPLGAWAFFLSWLHLPPARAADAEPGAAPDPAAR